MLLEGAAVKTFFETHPEARETVETMEAQFVICPPDIEMTHDEMYRLLTLNDIKYLSIGGWCGEPGVYAWYYPGGVPHYMKVADSLD